MSKTNKKTFRLRGDHLKKRIESVVNQMLYDTEVTPGQITVAEVAKRVSCSRVAIYENKMASVVRLAQEKKMKAVDYSNKLMKARKPKLIKMQDRIQELREELANERLRKEKTEQLLYRFMINVINNSSKLDLNKDIDQLLSAPVEPLAFKKYSPFVHRKKEDYLERLLKCKRN